MTWFPGKPCDTRPGVCFGSSGGGSPQSQPTQTTTTSSTQPWKAQQPFLKTGFEAAESEILDQPLSFFPGNTYVPYSSQTEQALAGTEQRAMGGNPLLGLAQQNQADTLRGDYLFNPNFDPVAESIRAQVQPMVSQQFAAANRQGSPLQAEATATGITRGLAPYAYNDFRQGRVEQERAAAMAPQLAREDYYDLGQLGQVGAARENLSGRQLADEMARHEFGQMEPYSRIPAYQGIVGGNYGGTSTGTTTGQAFFPQQQTNPLLMGLGGAASLAGIGSSLFSPFGMFGSGGFFTP